jgi:chorismate mutase
MTSNDAGPEDERERQNADADNRDRQDTETDEQEPQDAETAERERPQDPADAPAPEDMGLPELRDEIQDIDEALVELIARRTYVADTIAQVKRDEGLPTTDETQEQRVMERAGENAERFDVDANLVKAIFRLLIELNKVEQRENR